MLFTNLETNIVRCFGEVSEMKFWFSFGFFLCCCCTVGLLSGVLSFAAVL